MVWTTRNFHIYIVGNTFKIYMEHYSLQWLQTMKAMGCALLHCWQCELEEFNLVIKH